MAELRPSAVIGSGAVGSDLLAARAARLAGARVTMVLAGDAATFRETYVADKGAVWASLFDDLRLAPQVRVIEHGTTTDDDAAVNTELLRSAGEACAAQERVVVVTAGPDPGRTGKDHTEDLATSAATAGHLVLRLDPTLERDEAPVAFVAMPFGSKADPTAVGRVWESDTTWHRILLPSLLAAGYRLDRDHRPKDARAMREPTSSSPA